MRECYCKINEMQGRRNKVDEVAQYLLDEVCSNYDYDWETALEGDKNAFRYYAYQIINLMK